MGVGWQARPAGALGRSVFVMNVTAASRLAPVVGID
jgi:hypothetical protein